MSAAAAPINFISKRALVALAVLALIAVAVFATATATSAHQTIVHTHLAKDGTTVVSGYDGGAPLAPKSP
jgi:hypothetical protein